MEDVGELPSSRTGDRQSRHCISLVSHLPLQATSGLNIRRMVAVVTMNAGFFVAVLLGYFSGELVLGRIPGGVGGRR